ncbi:MAG: hypothetical protein ACRD40_00575 [Candidatus Acidiferrales bacterium]
MSDNTRHSDTPSSGVGKRIRCDVQNCVQPAMMRIDFHLFCLNHVVAHCHERLQTCQEQVGRTLVPSSDSITDNYRFVRECASSIAGFLVARSELANIDRARLLDIMLWAAELDEKYDRPLGHYRSIAKSAAGS